MKTLVTGGAGFIGSHLVGRLLEDGHNVVVIDNFSTGRIQNLTHHGKNPKLTIYNIDISKPDNLLGYFEGIDWVFHAAALADIVPSIKDPISYHKSNVDGTINILEAARLSSIKRFIYIASSSCYGIPDVFPTPETAAIRPQYPYALSKYLGECCAIHWAQVYKLPVVSLRLFNVYGPRARTSGTYGAVFGVFLTQKINNQPFTVVGNGKQTRDFTFVTDVVDAVIKAVESNLSGEILNVGSGNTYSINKLIDILKGDVVYIPKRPGEPDCTFADIAKMMRLLKWKPRYSFEEGVKIMLQNIDYWKEAPLWNPESISEATKEWFRFLS